jgi:hypothetical protein
VQLRFVSGDFGVMGAVSPSPWQVVQVGAPDTGEVPDTAWQVPQLPLKAVVSAPVWPASRYGMLWFAAPGPPEWQVAPLKEAEKQLGAPGSGPVPAPSTLWQIAHATVRFPELRWEGV